MENNMKTQILGLSGRKQSGKNTAANFIHGMKMVENGIIPNFRFSKEGTLIVPSPSFDSDGNETLKYGSFEIDRKDWQFEEYMSTNVWPFVKLYSFADILKIKICIDVLGLTYDQCYGTDNNKNEKTSLTWESMPTKTENKGSMTAREAMQYVGTDIFRKMNTDIWANATMRQVESEGSALAIICDCRFPNEVKAIKEAGGKVIRMTRNGKAEDGHSSECALDKDNFDWSNFDAVVENDVLSTQEANERVYSLMTGWGMVSMEYERTYK